MRFVEIARLTTEQSAEHGNSACDSGDAGCSPHFLFRIEHDTAASPHAISDVELASRLSYFLWNGFRMPDDELMTQAESRKNSTSRRRSIMK